MLVLEEEENELREDIQDSESIIVNFTWEMCESEQFLFLIETTGNHKYIQILVKFLLFEIQGKHFAKKTDFAVFDWVSSSVYYFYLLCCMSCWREKMGSNVLLHHSTVTESPLSLMQTHDQHNMNKKRKINQNTSSFPIFCFRVVYEVTIRRMNCLPDPPEIQIPC